MSQSEIETDANRDKGFVEMELDPVPTFKIEGEIRNFTMRRNDESLETF